MAASAVQQMRSANVPGANNLCPSKVSRHLQHARKVNAQEQDIKTFGGLAEFVQSRMMFAEGGGSFHPDLLAMENAIHEPRVIYSHLDEGNIKFVLVWSSVHMLLNLYRSTLPSLPHGGWLGCDTTHGLIYKFGTKEFVLSCFNTMDLQRHSHRVADMLSSHKKGEDYAAGLTAIVVALKAVLSIHKEHQSTADPSDRICIGPMMYQQAADTTVSIDEPDPDCFGIRVTISDNDDALQNAAQTCLLFGDNAMKELGKPALS